MAISSLIVECFPQKTQYVAEQLATIKGVEVHGTDETAGKIVVTIEVPGISASHDTAASFVRIDGVLNVNLIVANFEDENLGPESDLCRDSAGEE